MAVAAAVLLQSALRVQARLLVWVLLVQAVMGTVRIFQDLWFITVAAARVVAGVLVLSVPLVYLVAVGVAIMTVQLVLTAHQTLAVVVAAAVAQQQTVAQAARVL